MKTNKLMQIEVDGKTLVPLTKKIIEDHVNKKLYTYVPSNGKIRNDFLFKKQDKFYIKNDACDICLGELNEFDDSQQKVFTYAD